MQFGTPAGSRKFSAKNTFGSGPAAEFTA